MLAYSKMLIQTNTKVYMIDERRVGLWLLSLVICVFVPRVVEPKRLVIIYLESKYLWLIQEMW